MLPNKDSHINLNFLLEPVPEKASGVSGATTDVTEIGQTNFGADDSSQRQLDQTERQRSLHHLLPGQRRRKDLELQLQNLNFPAKQQKSFLKTARSGLEMIDQEQF